HFAVLTSADRSAAVGADRNVYHPGVMAGNCVGLGVILQIPDPQSALIIAAEGGTTVRADRYRLCGVALFGENPRFVVVEWVPDFDFSVCATDCNVPIGADPYVTDPPLDMLSLTGTAAEIPHAQHAVPAAADRGASVRADCQSSG